MGVAEGIFDFDLELKERSSLATILDKNSYTFNWIPLFVGKGVILLGKEKFVIGVRHMSTWCSVCSAFVVPVVDPADYSQLSFLPRGAAVIRIPTDSAESLRSPISCDDLNYCLGQSPYGRAPGPDHLPYELLKGAPDQLKETLRECLNSILEGGATPPKSWLGELVRFLLLVKKGDPLDIACYRPLLLQCCQYVCWTPPTKCYQAY